LSISQQKISVKKLGTSK